MVLLLVALVWGIDNAESTLRADASDSLTANGYRVSVDFSGRDARLIGTVTSAQLAEDVAQSIDSLPGVRHVHNELVVVDPEPPLHFAS